MDRSIEKVKLSKLFTTSFFISFFIIGSGHVALPIYRKKFVEEEKWLNEKEMSDILVIAQCSPGAIAVNIAVALGYRIAGLPGSLVMVLGTLIPSLVLMSLIQVFYSTFHESPLLAALFTGMNAAVAAVLVNVLISMIAEIKAHKTVSYLLIATSFVLVYFLKIQVAYVVLGGIVLAAILSWKVQE